MQCTYGSQTKAGSSKAGLGYKSLASHQAVHSFNKHFASLYETLPISHRFLAYSSPPSLIS